MSSEDDRRNAASREDAAVDQMVYSQDEDVFAQTEVLSLDDLEPDLNDEGGTNNSMLASEGGETYFPPTDPVIVPESNDRGGARVVGGLEEAADNTILLSAEGEDERVAITDDELVQALYEELGRDALTLDLDIEVLAVNGVVILRGQVATLEDAEAAESVTARVPGVVDVQEELSVSGL